MSDAYNEEVNSFQFKPGGPESATSEATSNAEQVECNFVARAARLSTAATEFVVAREARGP
eukprot:465888-Lingulodinium_polyedra.AAC.1